MTGNIYVNGVKTEFEKLGGITASVPKVSKLISSAAKNKSNAGKGASVKE